MLGDGGVTMFIREEMRNMTTNRDNREGLQPLFGDTYVWFDLRDDDGAECWVLGA